MILGAIRAGIIGANVNVGWGASVHIPALRALPEYEILAVATTRIETAQESADRFGIARAYGSAAALIADPDIDLVSVCVRVPYHFDIVKAALQAGKDIYCEWPLTVTTQEARILADLARRGGNRTAIGLQGRADTALCYVKDLLDDGLIGTLHSASLIYSSTWPIAVIDNYAPMQDARSGLSQLELSAGHSLDIMAWLAGEFDWLDADLSTHVPTVSVIDTGATIGRTSADQIVVHGRLQSGAVLSAHIGGAPGAGAGCRIEFQGDKGSLVLTSTPGVGRQPIQTADFLLDHYVDGKGTRLPIPSDYIIVPDAPTGLGRDPTNKGGDLPAGPSRNVAGIYRRFAEARKAGRPFDNDFALALRRHEMLDAIRQSAAERQRVTFRPTS